MSLQIRLVNHGDFPRSFRLRESREEKIRDCPLILVPARDPRTGAPGKSASFDAGKLERAMKAKIANMEMINKLFDERVLSFEPVTD